MPNSGLSGPFPLTNNGVDGAVTRTSPGAYALGYTTAVDNVFHIFYVGRADADLNKRLKDHIGEQEEFLAFKALYSESAKAAFEKECALYHDFDTKYNVVHPARPRSSYWACPRGCALG